MNDIDLGAFSALFQQACVRCFGHGVTTVFTETEAKLFYTKVFEATGLVVGWKSIKNYSGFLTAGSGKAENPSVATLDTLARYVAGAAYTSEPERKATAGHYPYWYGYRERWVAGRGAAAAPEGGVAAERPTGVTERRADERSAAVASTQSGRRSWMRWLFGGIAVGLVVVVIAFLVWVLRGDGAETFRDDFHALSADSLAARGWKVVAPDTVYWNRRGAYSGELTLYTLGGDNWPDPARAPVIRNLLQRRVPCGAFRLECHLTQFLPRQNWQQAGILLSEDTGIGSRSLRVSIAYNDYNGVYPRSGMILLQAIVSQPGGKPEEIAHVVLYQMDSLLQHPALASYLAHAALRIEKWGNQFRIWYADGVLENSSFREIASHELDLEPRYAGLFALKGFVDSAENMPVRFASFSLDCEKRK